MIEFYVLFALILNIIADLMIWREVKKAKNGFKEFTESLGPALTDHAKMTAKALGSAIGYYQGKAQKAAEGEVEGLQDTLTALGPLVQLMDKGQSTKKEGGNGKFHM